MKKIIDFRCYVSVNGEPYCDTSIWKRLRYDDVIGESETIITDWESAYQAVSEHSILNAETSETLFTNRPTIKIHYGDVYRNDREISEKEFKSLKYKWVASETDRIYTIKELAEYLPADQFCEWLKDQGLSINFNFGG